MRNDERIDESVGHVGRIENDRVAKRGGMYGSI